MKRKLLLAAAVLLLGAASAAGGRLHVTLPAGSNDHGESAMLTLKPLKGGS
jgi:hypothetical protein